MNKGRMEAFSDGVIAIIITIMVLEFRVPSGTGPQALIPLVPVFLSYLLSFVFVGIYWNNHHHLLQASHHVSGPILWANMHLLFWLSLVPFATSWMGHNASAPWPVALYGGVLWMAGIAYYILARALVSRHGRESVLAAAIGRDYQGLVSLGVYTTAIPFSFVDTRIALGLYIVVAVMWLIPDKRIEKVLPQ